jgi:peptidoglycan/LPS O-acetylase OafA/YrhL
MTALIIFIVIIIGLNCIPLLTKNTFPRIEKVIRRILIATAILFLTFQIFEFSGYRLKGNYIFPTIIWAFMISTILFFVLFKNTKKKILTVLILTPLIVFSILTHIIGQVVYEQRIDENNKISVTTGGFLACGEIINITQTRLGIFDKEVFHIDNLCLIGINKIERLFSNYRVIYTKFNFAKVS